MVALRLRAVAAVLGTAAGLDRQQRRELHRVRRVMLAMDLLRAEDELGKRQRDTAPRSPGPSIVAGSLPAEPRSAERSCFRRMASRGPRALDSSVRRALGVSVACARSVPSSRARRVSGEHDPCQIARPKHLTARDAALPALRAARGCALPQRCELCVADCRRRAAVRPPAQPSCRASPPPARPARSRHRTASSAAPVSRVRRRGRARSRRSSTRFPSTGCCSSSNIGAVSRSPIGRVPSLASARVAASLAAHGETQQPDRMVGACRLRSRGSASADSTRRAKSRARVARAVGAAA